MLVFYDPNNKNQVMAVYTHGTDSKVWGDRGFKSVELDEGTPVTRDMKLVFLRDGLSVTTKPSPNSEQPKETA
jgi:hypothetical protein